MKLKNNIAKILQVKNISINRLAQEIGLTYSNTHGLVNREDLGDTKLGTLVDVANVLNVNINKLFKEEDKMKKYEFTSQEIIEGKNRADLEEVGEFKAEYIKYNMDIGRGTAYGTLYNNEREDEEELEFELSRNETDRIYKYRKEVTAGDIFNAGWEDYNI